MAVPSQLSPGTTLGRYVIERLIGSGGMGAVYAARDPAVDRSVAIKVLHSVAHEVEWRERFFAELRILGKIDNEHVVRVYDFGEANDLLYLVTELLHGEDLSQAIAAGHLAGIERKLDVARQVASTLRDVHAAGIVHRDLKPANIFIDRSDRVKMIDFGISRASEAPTITLTGSLPCTPMYTAPERISGESSTPLVDIYSFGVLLFELFSGRRPFSGSLEQVVFAVVHDPIPLTALPPDTPRAIVDLIARTTAKQPGERIQTFAEVLAALDGVRGDAQRPFQPVVTQVPFWHSVSALALVVMTLAAVAVWVIGRATSLPAAIPPQRLAVTQVTAFPGIERFPSLSPDGRWLLYDREESGKRQIYLQAVGGQNPINLTNDSAASDSQAAFSPNGEAIVFRSERRTGGLFIMGKTGESVRRLSPDGFNPAWSPDGREVAAATELVFSPYSRNGGSHLFVISVETGARRTVVDTDAVQPAWSPHGDRIAYWRIQGGNRQRDIWTVAARGGPPVPVTDDEAIDWNPVWAPDGRYLYFVSNRGGSMNMWRVAIDEHSGSTQGPPQPMVMPVASVSDLTVSTSGQRFAFSTIHDELSPQSIAFDPATAKVIGEPRAIIVDTHAWRAASPSPDGSLIALMSNPPRNEDIWVLKADGTGLTQLTNDAAFDRVPRWSPDGTRIAFYSNRGQTQQIWTIRPDGSDLRRVSNQPGQGLLYPVWSPDGRRIIASSQDDDSLVIFDPDVPWSAQSPTRIPPENPTHGPCGPTSWFLQRNTITCLTLNEPARVVSLDAHEWRRLENLSVNDGWLPDGRRLIAITDDDRLTMVDLATEQRKELLALPSYGIADANISKDGRTIYFVKSRTVGDIYIADAADALPR